MANWCSSAALQAPINLPWDEINGTILEVSYCNSHSPGIFTVQFNIFLITLFLHCYLCLSLYIQSNILLSTPIGRKSPQINWWMIHSHKSPEGLLYMYLLLGSSQQLKKTFFFTLFQFPHQKHTHSWFLVIHFFFLILGSQN